jgi:hypothetical protein
MHRLESLSMLLVLCRSCSVMISCSGEDIVVPKDDLKEIYNTVESARQPLSSQSNNKFNATMNNPT